MGDAKFASGLVKTGTAIAKHCNAGSERVGLDTLYHGDCVSVEALEGPNGQEAHGLKAIRAKHDWWESAFEEHKVSALGPFFNAPDRFTLIFHMNVTDRASGQRMQMSEIGLYTVDTVGLIIREEFSMRPQTHKVGVKRGASALFFDPARSLTLNRTPLSPI
jgi:hypothetical protein